MRAIPPSNPFLRHIWNRTHHYKMNWLQVVTGEVGSGKSYCCLTMGELLDKRFNINKVCFTPREFMDAIDDVKFKGEVVVFDEVGIGLSSRKWHTISNLLTNEVIQTFRYKNIVTFFTVPDFSFVDSQARKVIQCFSEARRRGKSPTKLWIYKMSPNRKTGDMYFVHPRIVVNGHLSKIRYITFKRLPSEKLRKEYEEKHLEYKEKLRKKNVRVLELIEKKEEVAEKTLYDMINEVIKNKEKFLNKRGNLDKFLISMHFNISRDKASQIKSYVEKQLHTH